MQIALVMFAAEGMPKPSAKAGKLLATLTPRQREIVGMVAAGMRQDEMIETMGMWQTSLAKHLRNIRQKLGARTLVDVVRTGL